MWFPPIPSLPSSPPFYDFIEQWKANRTCSEYSARRCMGTVVASLFRIDFSAAGVIDSRCRPIWLWRSSLSTGYINFENYSEFWMPASEPRVPNYDGVINERAPLSFNRFATVLLFSTCCSLLGSDNCSENEKFVSIGWIYFGRSNERGGKLCALIFSNWQVKFYFSFLSFMGIVSMLENYRWLFSWELKLIYHFVMLFRRIDYGKLNK